MAAMRIEFEPATTGGDGRPLKSRYSADGSFPKRRTEMPHPKNVRQLKELLSQIPDKLPIEQGFSKGTRLVWFNVGDASEHLELKECD